MITQPKVTLWAETQITQELLELLPFDPHTGYPNEHDHLAEAAGRACYASFHRPNPATAKTSAYVKHILDVGHESVLAHASATFYIEGVSRSLTHELVRSRFLAFSQISQRYVNSHEIDWVCPPLALNNLAAQAIIENDFRQNIHTYEVLVRQLDDKWRGSGMFGKTELRKRCREVARSVLPNCTETKIVVTGNMRAWRDFLKLRIGPDADLEIQRLAVHLAYQLKKLAPATFQDIIADTPVATADLLESNGP